MHSRPPATTVWLLSLLLTPLGDSFRTPPPTTRIKGEIACYSCFSVYDAITEETGLVVDEVIDVSPITNIIREAGMKVPAYVPRCSDRASPGNTNLHGARIHLCRNSMDEPGACVKLKGRTNGSSFVYRDCWEQMWHDPRPFHHRMSQMCFSDEMVQNFIATEQNTICFCEDDLCNAARAISPLVPLLVISVYSHLATAPVPRIYL